MQSTRNIRTLRGPIYENPGCSSFHSTIYVPPDEKKTPDQFLFFRYMILPINHVLDWRYIRQRKQTQIKKDTSREYNTIIDHNYRLVDKVTTKIRSAYKYETLFRCPYEIFLIWKNGTVTLRTGVVTHIINIRNINPYNNADV